MEFKIGVSRPEKSWRITVVWEPSWKSHGIPSIGHGIFNRRILGVKELS